MINYFPYVKPGYVTREGTTPLYIRYNYSRTRRTLIATGYRIRLAHWDAKRRWVKPACPACAEISARLFDLTTRIDTIVACARQRGIDPTAAFVRAEVKKSAARPSSGSRADLLDALEGYMAERAAHVSPGQLREYRTLRKHLAAFRAYSSQPLSFGSLNRTFYNEFLDYLFCKAVKPDGTRGLLTNTAGKVVRLLKAFARYEMDKGSVPYASLKCFKAVEEETDAIYLDEQELAAIYQLDLSGNRRLEEIRDLFIVGCYTGLRYSDLTALEPEHIDRARQNIVLRQRKVHKAVVIPLIDYVPHILQKYGYRLPRYSRSVFNAAVKELGQRAGLTQAVELVRKRGNERVRRVCQKWELIYSHTCRRSFCTNMYLAGFPAEDLMRISGHKSPATFMRYVKVNSRQAADRLRTLRACRQL